jgi:hypothetical protein
LTPQVTTRSTTTGALDSTRVAKAVSAKTQVPGLDAHPSPRPERLRPTRAFAVRGVRFKAYGDGHTGGIESGEPGRDLRTDHAFGEIGACVAIDQRARGELLGVGPPVRIDVPGAIATIRGIESHGHLPRVQHAVVVGIQGQHVHIGLVIRVQGQQRRA